MKKFLIIIFIPLITFGQDTSSWIRINQLGYTPSGIKVAVFCSKASVKSNQWQLFNTVTKKFVLGGKLEKNFGTYGPFTHTFRINFSKFIIPGKYYLEANGVRSPEFRIGDDVYKGAADFCLRYMRQQRTGFNPYLKDSCHTHDGYVLYGEKAGIKDSTRIDVVGGWHDASDYLQYSTTSANATYHLLMAYRDFPKAFGDEKQANGLDGKNGMADVLDEAKWGLDWLLKMHPGPDWLFNQIADDRDHMGMRMPAMDSFYGRGFQRPVYFVSGEPQQRGKFMNNTTGTSSTASKFVSAFALGSEIFEKRDTNYADLLFEKASSAYGFSKTKLGVTQTASVRSPYIYAEDNWADDVELSNIALASANDGSGKFRRLKRLRKPEGPVNPFIIGTAYWYAKMEPHTPWLGSDTAKHYQWYPFINIGHYELAKYLEDKRRDTIISFYKEGIEKVWNKAKHNAFYRGVPFIWCSNNLTTSFAIQCYWYKELTGDNTFSELEQANFDWLFGCNPWGTSMVYGLPSWGDTPVDPHSAFTHIKKYPIDGGLVDGPVYTSIYKNLIGITLYEPDEYAQFQSDLAVYHDDYGDYSTNEPTMDGTASLIYLLAAKESKRIEKQPRKNFTYSYGAITRGDSTQKKIALVFTGDEYGEGGNTIADVLQKEKVKASFFLTGRFYRNPEFRSVVQKLKQQGHYLGPHSDQHLLYNDWIKRDSLLTDQDKFEFDMLYNLKAMGKAGIAIEKVKYFLPPYEWYNDTIAGWTKELNMQLINYSPGTLSHADYTKDADKNYRDNQTIYRSILNYENGNVSGLNGFILLMHIGAGPGRTEKFYELLPQLLSELRSRGYTFETIDQLLK